MSDKRDCTKRKHYNDNGKWSGDIIAYGQWRDLDDEEVEGYKCMIGVSDDVY